MDKKLLSDYIDACELIRETEQQIRRLQEKQSETTQDSVRRASLCAGSLCLHRYILRELDMVTKK